jgi:hypothetical protein
MRVFKITVIAAALAISAFCLGVGSYNQNYAQNQQSAKHRPV